MKITCTTHHANSQTRDPWPAERQFSLLNSYHATDNYALNLTQASFHPGRCAPAASISLSITLGVPGSTTMKREIFVKGRASLTAAAPHRVVRARMLRRGPSTTTDTSCAMSCAALAELRSKSPASSGAVPLRRRDPLRQSRSMGLAVSRLFGDHILPTTLHSHSLLGHERSINNTANGDGPESGLLRRYHARRRDRVDLSTIPYLSGRRCASKARATSSLAFARIS